MKKVSFNFTEDHTEFQWKTFFLIIRKGQSLMVLLEDLDLQMFLQHFDCRKVGLHPTGL